MNKSLKSAVKYLLLLGIAGLMLWLAFRGVNLSETIDEIRQAKLSWLLLSVITSLVAFFSRAIRWNLLIQPLGYRPAVMNTSAALMLGYLANLAVPRLGEVTRCGTLNQVEKVPFDKLLGTVIIERLIDVICLLICIMLVAVLEYQRLGNFLDVNIFIPLRSKAGVIIDSPLLSLLIVALIILSVILILKSNRSKGALLKIREVLKGIGAGITSVKKMQQPFYFILHTILIWVMYFLMSYFCFFSLPATSMLDWHAGLFVLVVGGMGMSAPVQGGIGAYHLLVSQGLILYGISQTHGLAFATLMHTSQTLVVIIFGALSFLYLFLKKKNAAVEPS